MLARDTRFDSDWSLCDKAGCHVQRFLLRSGQRDLRIRIYERIAKILVVDGQVGFTGGMNIRAGCYHALQTKHAFHDLHFRCRGPVVSQLQEAFAEIGNSPRANCSKESHGFPF